MWARPAAVTYTTSIKESRGPCHPEPTGCLTKIFCK